MTTSSSRAVDFFVKRNDLRACSVAEAPPLDALPLAPGHAIARLDRFGFSANNITYGRLGDALGYWRFFPAPEGLGRIPVWGFGDVVRSSHEGVPVGMRVYGYFPMSTYATLEPVSVGADGFADGAAHRKDMHAVYNRYSVAEPNASEEREAEVMLLRPLVATAFLLDDFLADSAFFGARNILVASASSKTAVAVARMLARREGGPARIGLTGRATVEFVQSLGVYDRVVAYDDLGALEVDGSAIYLDLAGNDSLRAAVRARLGDRLVYDCVVGATHWEAPARSDAPRATGSGRTEVPKSMFFAPAWLAKRAVDWGGSLRARLHEAQESLFADARKTLRVVRAEGPEEALRVYREVLEGRAHPGAGYVLSLSRGL